MDLFDRRQLPLRGRRMRASDDSAETYQSLAGGTLIAQWHSMQGISLLSGLQSWRDGIQALTVARPGIPQSPTYAVDGSNFGSRPVVGTVAASGKSLFKQSISPVLIPTASKPWVMILGRISSFAAGPRWFFRVNDTPPTANVLNLYVSAGVLNGGSGDTNGSTTFSDTGPHIFEAYLTAANHSCLAVDGVTLYDAAAAATTVNATAVGIGCNSNGINVLDAFFALVLIGNAPLTDLQRSNLRAFARHDFGM